jgi:Fur family ferric uptake transcriptional regulator/Fur family zinc uptake transcriptional regulator
MSPSASDLLRSAGLRRTPARLAVLARIEALARPISHADLQALPDLAELDDITLYRTLAALVEARLVHRVHGIDGTWRYCAQPRGQEGCPGNHAHFLCTSCGSMTCLVAQPMPRVDVPLGAEVQGRHFLVHGRCAACVAAPPASSRPGDTT